MNDEAGNTELTKSEARPNKLPVLLEFAQWRTTRKTSRVLSGARTHVYEHPYSGWSWSHTVKLYEDASGNCRLRYTDAHGDQCVRVFSGRGYAEGALYALIRAGFVCE